MYFRKIIEFFKAQSLWTGVAAAVIAGLILAMIFRYLKTPNPEPRPNPPPSQIQIYINLVPRADPAGGAKTHGDIAGSVEGISNPSNYAVVIYAKTDSWYVQPESEKPLTDIGRKGQWNNWTHLGSSYAAILVERPYNPPPVLEALPTEAGNILAKKVVEGTKTR